MIRFCVPSYSVASLPARANVPDVFWNVKIAEYPDHGDANGTIPDRSSLLFFRRVQQGVKQRSGRSPPGIEASRCIPPAFFWLSIMEM